MVAQCELAIGLPDLFVGGCLWDSEGPVGFLQGDVDVGLPGLGVALIVVGGGAIGESDGGASEHGVDVCAEEESEEEAPASAYAPADDGKEELEAEEAGHGDLRFDDLLFTIYMGGMGIMGVMGVMRAMGSEGLTELGCEVGEGDDLVGAVGEPDDAAGDDGEADVLEHEGVEG